MSAQHMSYSKYTTKLPWKSFVRESENVPTIAKEKEVACLKFEGQEAKVAYERIIKEIPDNEANKHKQFNKSNTHTINKVIAKNISQGNNEFIKETEVGINAILKAVEEKDLNFLMKHVTPDNVNMTDNFGWTPLMSAAYCGYMEIVDFLLNTGANRKAKDKSGYTAAQLALKRNHFCIVALIRRKSETNTAEKSVKPIVDMTKINIVTNPSTIDRMDGPDSLESIVNNKQDQMKPRKKNNGFYCEVCDATFYYASKKGHETSTLHIFNTNPKLPDPVYGISKQSKGYQMLLHTGWDEKEGLGPFGKGIKYPVKTYLKTDRKGLGQPIDKEPRVTHFKPGDVKAISNPNLPKQKCLKKRDRERLLSAEARKERMDNKQRAMLTHLQEVEEKAGEILTDRQEIIALDKRRNDDRVGMRALQKTTSKNAWITVGPLLLKLPSKTAEQLLVKDQQECDVEVNKLRSNLKIKVNELRDLELNPAVPGLMLKPMSHKEMSAINQVLGQSS